MKNIFFILIAVLSVNIVKAQTIKELESRYSSADFTTTTSIVTTNSSSQDSSLNIFTPKEKTKGISYSYSNIFPLTLSYNDTFSYFSLSWEFGANLNTKLYKLNTVDPCYYLTISPGLDIRFLSFNCGLGALKSIQTKTTILEEANENTEPESIHTPEGNKWYFILKPSMTGYIPIYNEDFYITINIGYNYFPNLKELNGWSFGIGFQIVSL